MGKVGSSSSSWLTAVKKVFRSPTKTSPKKNCKRRDEHSQEDEEERKKTEKKRWIFRKLSNNNQQYDDTYYEKKIDSMSMNEAIAVAEATTAAAKAAVATAQAAVRFQGIIPAYLAREYYAALIIQTAFRGYLARRALRALKGIVKLQALVRGTNIRKQAKATLKCMQTLIRVQAKLRDQSFSRPLSHHGLIRKSMYAESNNLWDKYKDIHQRKSLSRDENNIEDGCKFQSYTIEDIEAMLQSKKEASLHREQALAYALSEQIRRIDRKKCSRDAQVEDKDTEWLSQWLDSKEYNENNNILTAHKTDSIKNIDMMESVQQPHLRTPASFQRSQHHQDPSSNRRQSLHVAHSLNNARPMTPPLYNTRPLQVQSASPRCVRSQSAANTPSLRVSRTSPSATMPNYMAATESARAKARTQSTPRQRHSTSDRERGGSSVKKRLSFPIPEQQYPGRIYTDYSSFSQNLRSPSFRSVQEGLYYLERGTTCSSYTDITAGEVSPASTSHLRRWLS